MKVIDGYGFFWKGYLSNWAKPLVPIEYDGKQFPTSEHVFMYIKAKTFQDEETANKILETDSPKEAKKLGRQVKGFNEITWNAFRENAMFNALMARAKYDIKFRNSIVNLINSHDFFTFVEASPVDTIWGIGLSEEDPDILNKDKWKGLNLLGKVMNQVACWWLDESRLNTWKDKLLWCPSQCYYFFREKNTGELKCLYLRWRHDDPWTVDLIPVNEIDRSFGSDWEEIDVPFFKDSELDLLKEWCMKKLKELDLI